MGFPILVRWHLYIGSEPRSLLAWQCPLLPVVCNGDQHRRLGFQQIHNRLRVMTSCNSSDRTFWGSCGYSAMWSSVVHSDIIVLLLLTTKCRIQLIIYPLPVPRICHRGHLEDHPVHHFFSDIINYIQKSWWDRQPSLAPSQIPWWRRYWSTFLRRIGPRLARSLHHSMARTS